MSFLDQRPSRAAHDDARALAGTRKGPNSRRGEISG